MQDAEEGSDQDADPGKEDKPAQNVMDGEKRGVVTGEQGLRQWSVGLLYKLAIYRKKDNAEWYDNPQQQGDQDDFGMSKTEGHGDA